MLKDKVPIAKQAKYHQLVRARGPKSSKKAKQLNEKTGQPKPASSSGTNSDDDLEQEPSDVTTTSAKKKHRSTNVKITPEVRAEQYKEDGYIVSNHL